jgi:hypothetical protein
MPANLSQLARSSLIEKLELLRDEVCRLARPLTDADL